MLLSWASPACLKVRALRQRRCGRLLKPWSSLSGSNAAVVANLLGLAGHFYDVSVAGTLFDGTIGPATSTVGALPPSCVSVSACSGSVWLPPRPRLPSRACPAQAFMLRRCQACRCRAQVSPPGPVVALSQSAVSDKSLTVAWRAPASNPCLTGFSVVLSDVTGLQEGVTGRPVR